VVGLGRIAYSPGGRGWLTVILRTVGDTCVIVIGTEDAERRRAREKVIWRVPGAV
jgi:hypothetical protein